MKAEKMFRIQYLEINNFGNKIYKVKRVLKEAELTKEVAKIIIWKAIDNTWASHRVDEYPWSGKLIPLENDEPFQTNETTEGVWYKENDVSEIISMLCDEVFKELKKLTED